MTDTTEDAAEGEVLPATHAVALLSGGALVPAEVYKPGGINAVIDAMERDVRSITVDISTEKGRTAARSLARKIGSSKTALDNMGKEMTEEWAKQKKVVDADRAIARTRLDALRDEVLQPLTEWEEEEAARIAAHQAALAELVQPVSAENSSADIKAAIERLENREPRAWGEFKSRAKTAVEDEEARLKAALAAAMEREAAAEARRVDALQGCLNGLQARLDAMRLGAQGTTHEHDLWLLKLNSEAYDIGPDWQEFQQEAQGKVSADITLAQEQRSVAQEREKAAQAAREAEIAAEAARQAQEAASEAAKVEAARVEADRLAAEAATTAAAEVAAKALRDAEEKAAQDAKDAEDAMRREQEARLTAQAAQAAAEAAAAAAEARRAREAEEAEAKRQAEAAAAEDRRKREAAEATAAHQRELAAGIERAAAEERQRQADAQAAQEEADRKRAEDQEHRQMVNREVLAALRPLLEAREPFDAEGIANALIDAMAGGHIPHVKMEY